MTTLKFLCLQYWYKKIISIVRNRYRNYTHVYRSCLLIYGIAIVRSLSFSFLDDFEGNPNISVAMKSRCTAIKNVAKKFGLKIINQHQLLRVIGSCMGKFTPVSIARFD